MIEDKEIIDFILSSLEDALEKMKKIEMMFLILEEESHYSIKNDDESIYLRTMHIKLQGYIKEIEGSIFILKNNPF